MGGRGKGIAIDFSSLLALIARARERWGSSGDVPGGVSTSPLVTAIALAPLYNRLSCKGHSTLEVV